ncbi:hypothetical protein GCM10009792_13500 [Microcella alkalica]|uniref:Uncharacterized protein n=1 Tax=Microcella alkalica TaxID=355930 RepID=A0A839EFV1_9MICO|nr:DUF2510 domain-containing protein [Microcella alkalica]MBA8848478.1 hypothetical protein [Microcella alkalica]
MSTPYPDDEDDLDSVRPGWEPDPEREGYERWWTGERFLGAAHREPQPFSALSPDAARSMRPGPNRDARFARAGIVATLLGFLGQAVAASGLVRIPGVDSSAVVLSALGLAALTAAVTVVFAARGLRRASALGGRAISSLALGIGIVLGLAPVLLLVAIGIGGGL